MENNNIINISTIGKRIQSLREEKGLTQSELAKKLNVKQQTINQWENGERDLKTGSIIALSKYFNVTADYILCLSDYTAAERHDMGAITGLSDDNIKLLSEKIKLWSKEEVDVFNIFMTDILKDSIIAGCCVSACEFKIAYEMHDIFENDCDKDSLNHYEGITNYTYAMYEYNGLVDRMKNIINKCVDYIPDKIKKMEKDYAILTYNLVKDVKRARKGERNGQKKK